LSRACGRQVVHSANDTPPATTPSSGAGPPSTNARSIAAAEGDRRPHTPPCRTTGSNGLFVIRWHQTEHRAACPQINAVDGTLYRYGSTMVSVRNRRLGACAHARLSGARVREVEVQSKPRPPRGPDAHRSSMKASSSQPRRARPSRSSTSWQQCATRTTWHPDPYVQKGVRRRTLGRQAGR